MPSLLKEIETNYKVEDLEFRGIKIWPFLRIYIGSKLISDLSATEVSGKVLKSFFRSFLYGFKNLFHKYDFFILSSSNNRKLADGFYVDKNIDPIAAKLNNSLVFELPVLSHFSLSNIPTKHIVSKFVLYLPVFIYSRIFLRSAPIKEEGMLKEILEKYKLEINYRELILRHAAQYRLMLLLLRVYRPKKMFVVCYYSNMGYIKAFRDKGLDVIEIQHGIINDKHLAYNVYKKVDENFYPNYLFTFGNKEREVFGPGNHFIRQENVLPVGHYYLDYIARKYKGDEKFSELRKGYNKVVSITADGLPIDPETIRLIKNVAEKEPGTLFVYIPRNSSFDPGPFHFPENMKIAGWLNCYEIMSQSDFHSTVYSTCAIEALAMGIPNILININGLSEIHYGSLLSNSSATRLANTPEEFREALNTPWPLTKQELIDSVRGQIIPDYETHLNNALNAILH